MKEFIKSYSQYVRSSDRFYYTWFETMDENSINNILNAGFDEIMLRLLVKNIGEESGKKNKDKRLHYSNVLSMNQDFFDYDPVSHTEIKIDNDDNEIYVNLLKHKFEKHKYEEFEKSLNNVSPSTFTNSVNNEILFGGKKKTRKNKKKTHNRKK
jgi:hypothetical protein